MSYASPRQAQRRVDDTPADRQTLTGPGLDGEQPKPQYAGLFMEPNLPPVTDEFE
ncbi:hypothetical protein Sfulv_01740 [Streptomyces fulvorobeus]|uniref:Uncharacterized protein n=1 Tax=Streptomyces fulvorobeus TaxID=284028 RepID=A0A7J0C094_9ACTN|nr:hypothetical protein Sfulv_01740 [Streptomyces fulvorobeus]